MSQEKVKVVNMPVLLKEMKEAGLDAAIVASPENFFYLSGWKIQTQTLIRDRYALGIVTADGGTALVVAKQEEAQTKRYSWVADVRSYAEFAETPMKGAAAVLEEKGLSRARIGVEQKYVSELYFQDLKSRVPNATLSSCDTVFDKARMVKTAPEVQALREAASGTDEAIRRALETAKPGDPEHKLARVMSDSLFEIGQGEFRDLTWGVASGPNILVTHYWSGERKLAHDEMVRVNVRSTIKGYYSHLYRMAVVGKPSERHRSWYEKARDVHYRAIDRLRPGARACDLYHAARKDIEDAGAAFKGSLCGHSTGIALHENPRIQPLDETVLVPGMVIANEPLVVDPDYCIYHLEDLVLVTEKDPVLLSDRTDTRNLFVIQ
jgi:Xaa-Pro aminopeptidase